MARVVRALAVLLALVATPVLAEWSHQTLDDGTWFQASARSPGGEAVFACGGRSSRGLTPDQSAVTRPVLTRPGELELSLLARLFVGAPPPDQVRVRVNRQEYALSKATYDAPRRAFVLPVSAKDPVLAALADVRRFTVVPEDAGPIPVDRASESLAAVLEFCAARWAEMAAQVVESPERTKALAFAARRMDEDAPQVQRLELVDLNRDGVPEVFLVLGGRACGARLCDGFVLDVSGEQAVVLGSWPVATIKTRPTMLNGWRDVEVNGATYRYLRGRYRAE